MLLKRIWLLLVCKSHEELTRSATAPGMFWAGVMTMLSIAASPVLCQESHRSISEACAAYDDYLLHFKNLKGRIRQRLLNKHNETMLEKEMEIRRAECGYVFLMNITISKIDNVFQPFIFGRNSQYSFALRKFGPAKEWSATDVEQNTSIGKGSRLDKLEWAQAEVCKLYYVKGESIKALAAKKDFKVIKAVADNLSVNLYFATGQANGWMKLVPSEKWHIAEYHVNSAVASSAHCCHKVRSGKTGYPLLVSRLERFIGDKGPGDTVEEHYNIEEHQGLEEREFTLSAFGFPEPTYSRIQRRSSSSWYIICLGILLLGLARLCWTFQRKKSVP